MTTTCLINNYNYGRYVGEAIESALRQTQPFDEVIVVDDGSTDDSVDLLQSKYGDRSTVQVVTKENGGQLSSFNEGFLRATGDIVFFLDADDVFEVDYLASALQVYQTDPHCDFLYCGRRLFGREEGVALEFPEDRDLGYSVIRTACSRDWIGGATSTLSMRRSVLEKILPLPFLDEWRVRADDCLVFGASLAGARKRYLAQPLVKYRVHEGNNYHGKSSDPRATFRRRYAINRLFEYFERELSYNVRHLADFPHREFRTIENPTARELMRYIRISAGAKVSLVRRMACIAEMMIHFLGASLRKTEAQSSASSFSKDAPVILPFQAEQAADTSQGRREFASTQASQKAA